MRDRLNKNKKQVSNSEYEIMLRTTPTCTDKSFTLKEI